MSIRPSSSMRIALRSIARPNPSTFSRPILASQIRSTTSLPSHSSPRVPPQPYRPSTTTSTTQRRHLTDSVKASIKAAISSSPVVLFMKGTPETPQCGFSRASIQILGLQGVDPAKFGAFNVLEDEALRQGIKEYSEWPTIPQLYVDGEFVGGCDILVGMHQSGELAKLLSEKGVLVEGGAEATTDAAEKKV